MLNSFFWMCSGADPELLRQCPDSERIKYAGVGGTVFFTAVMAFVAGSYALYTIFDSVPLALGFGLMWSLLIFNLDRFIVSSMKKSDYPMRELGQAFPRIVLAVIIAVVIAKPLELKIFEKEIDRVMLSQQHTMTLEDQTEVAAIYFQERAEIREEQQVLGERLAKKEQEVDALYQTYISEAEGRDGTMLLGKGPVYAEKREKHDAALRELTELKASTAARMQELESGLRELELAEAHTLAKSAPVISGYDGLMARMEALSELPWLPSFFIFLLFLAIETAPVLTKLISPKGEYDIRFQDAEQKVKVWAEQKMHQRLALLQADKDLNKKVYSSIAEEEESYHHKKQLARGLIRWQSERFVEEQKGVVI